MARDSQVSALAMFSEELRRARAGASLTRDQLAEKIAYSPSLVAHVETGSRAPSVDFARRADDALRTGGLLSRLQPLVGTGADPAWVRGWVEVGGERGGPGRVFGAGPGRRGRRHRCLGSTGGSSRAAADRGVRAGRSAGGES